MTKSLDAALEAVSKIGKPHLVASHTPTPWFSQTEQTSIGDSVKIISLSSGVVCLVKNSNGRKKANAAFIVRACNAHDALVESNMQARVMMRNVIGRLRDAGKLGVEIDILEQAVDAVNDALKLARGEG